MPILQETFFNRGMKHISDHLRIKDVDSLYTKEVLKLFLGRPAKLYSEVVTRIIAQYDGFRMPTTKVWKDYRETAERIDTYSRLKPMETKAIDYHGENQVVIDRTIKRFEAECGEHVANLVVNGQVVTPRQHKASQAYFSILVEEYAKHNGHDLLGGLGFGTEA